MTIPELIERVGKLTGADVFTDALLHLHFHPELAERPWWQPTPGHWVDMLGKEDDQHAPEYTRSVDAALALVERVLPGWRMEQIAWGAPKHGDTLIMASIGNLQDGENYRSGDGLAATVPLAIILALLKAHSLPESTR